MGKQKEEPVDIIEWSDEVTTQVGKLTAGADGTEASLKQEVGPQNAGHAAVSTQTTYDVAVVYGSFFMGDSKRDASDIIGAFPSDLGKKTGITCPPSAVEGNNFDFNSLTKTKFLIVCTSSMYGNPPKNFWEFYYHLKAASKNPNKPLSHLQHTVYGNGDETYYDTYMNVPRMIDLLLERAGSRRFYARGETGEPHAPSGSKMINANDWAPGLWKTLLSASPSASPVPWDALWKGSAPNHHDKVTDWELEKLEKKFGKPSSKSIFAAPISKL